MCFRVPESNRIPSKWSIQFAILYGNQFWFLFWLHLEMWLFNSLAIHVGSSSQRNMMWPFKVDCRKFSVLFFSKLLVFSILCLPFLSFILLKWIHVANRFCKDINKTFAFKFALLPPVIVTDLLATNCCCEKTLQTYLNVAHSRRIGW